MNKKIVAYTAVVALSNDDTLVDQVSKMVKKGWQPQGGIAMVINGKELLSTQALVKYEETTNEI
jgi:hypothetical protein